MPARQDRHKRHHGRRKLEKRKRYRRWLHANKKRLNRKVGKRRSRTSLLRRKMM